MTAERLLTARERLAAVLAPDVVGALEELVAELVREEFADQGATGGGPRWVPVAEAARLEGCSVEAMRMRLARGRYETKHVGRSVLVAAASLEGRGDVGNGRGEA